MSIEIAIIGSGCRLPGGANTPSKLWDLLRDPRSLAVDVPWIKGSYHSDGAYHGHTNVKQAYLLEDNDGQRRFDAGFFAMSPAEANTLDPQIRLLLETVYEALETAGQTIEGLQGSSTAVYAGQMVGEYESMMIRDVDRLGTYHATISYFFDWRGPSITIDTACSSSLVALHYAVQQLRSGQSRLAIAAGANIIADTQNFIAESKMQMLSPEGRSRMWDATANGYARGEGVAAVVLKTLSAALEDGDHIECVIRETAVNQDGKTPGITMPSSVSQTSLIRACYAQAGLNPNFPSDRPQYFEAHGTGTQAGDVIEAEAIHTAFFSAPKQGVGGGAGDDGCLPILRVGSIKTVVGHTEGNAGLAGVIKASLALQHGEIPPNMLFNRLNPRIKTFYDSLEIPTSLTPWVALPRGVPRRASVNSFGFGGTNCHAILERPQSPTKLTQTAQTVLAFAPFVFSAASAISLVSYLSRFDDFLQKHENGKSFDVASLAYTLYARRSRLPVATAIAASNVHELRAGIQKRLKAARADPVRQIGIKPARFAKYTLPCKVLGIFTGQGAQWAQMGMELVTGSDAARATFERLQSRLDGLPAMDRPSWTILEELNRKAGTSRIHEAAISQPLCTAVQILQVDLLRAAGIQFHVVIGHSSGEIAAAYAAGFLSAGDAICIAYYRGLHSALARGPAGQKGSMLTVGTSPDDARDLLGFPEFQGRASLAAVNSASSVTLSGDADAIQHLKTIFEDEQKFVRTLKIDKAYHSHHMKPCSESYLSSLSALDIMIDHDSARNVVWVSSVHGKEVTGVHDGLEGLYWDRNMTSPVLFMQALEAACVNGPLDMAIEIGPHSALRGPVLQTIQNVLGHTVPYTAMFQRGMSSIVSFSDGLGYAWTHLGGETVDLHSYHGYISGGSSVKFLSGLPTYAWDHSKEYWHESRHARAERFRGPVQELLGHLTPDSTEHDMQWRNILRPTELPWLRGHRLANMIVFPGAGYIAMALDVATVLCRGQAAALVDVLDVDIGRALVFDGEDSSIEIIFSVTGVSRASDTITAEFRVHAESDRNTGALELRASGHIRVHLGEPSAISLPLRLAPPSSLVKVDSSQYYDFLRGLGYQYSGPFQALEMLQRTLGAVTGLVRNHEPSTRLIHPGVLDAAFHSVCLARGVPWDGSIWALHVPRLIRRVTFNPALISEAMSKAETMPFDAFWPEQGLHTQGKMVCDVEVYNVTQNHAMIQVEGLEAVPMMPATPKDDRDLFSTLKWSVAFPNLSEDIAKAEKRDFASVLIRLAAYYLRILDRDVPVDSASKADASARWLYDFVSHFHSIAESGSLPLWQPEWEHDTHENVLEACKPYTRSMDVQLLRAFGRHLVRTANGEQLVPEKQSLSQWAKDGLGASTCRAYLAEVSAQLVHRYPHMDILELGAEAGAATITILARIQGRFASYTSTDPGTPPRLDGLTFQDVAHKLVVTQFDPAGEHHSQKFRGDSFNLVLSSGQFDRSPNLRTTLQTIRRLLRQGGYLVMKIWQPAASSVFSTVVTALAGHDQRTSPALTRSDWDTMLRESGFSGVDTCTPVDGLSSPWAVLVTQAMDEKIELLREPLSLSQKRDSRVHIEDLVLLGSVSLRSTKLTQELKSLLNGYCTSVRMATSLSEIAALPLSPTKTTVLSLTDLDKPALKDLTETKWISLKRILLEIRTLCWITHGRRAGNPYASMIVGLVRGAMVDNPALQSLFLDFENESMVNALAISKILMRHMALLDWHSRGQTTTTSIERELMVDLEGRILIPRVVPNVEMNKRYNSMRRRVLALPRPGKDILSIYDHESGWELRQAPLAQSCSAEDRLRDRLITTHSILSSIRINEFDSAFLLLGHLENSESYTVALWRMNASVAHGPKELSCTAEVSPENEARFLALVACHILASIVLNGLSSGDRVLLYEPDMEFAKTVLFVAEQLGILATIITTRMLPGHSQQQWLRLHPSQSSRTLFPLQLENVSVFIDFSDKFQMDPVKSRLRSLLSNGCRKESLRSLFGGSSSSIQSSKFAAIRSRLTSAVFHALAALQEPTSSEEVPIQTIAVNALAERTPDVSPLSVVDWARQSQASAVVRTVDEEFKFSSSKTYWLVGLSGGIGQSLCKWIAQHGGRHFVITSRNPQVAESWLNEMRSMGVKTLKVLACDITRKSEVVILHSEICRSMPPIAGVAQGAMVLRDTNIRDMTLDQFFAVTTPKVEGSIHLNDLFQENTLDFFVFFSSVVSLVGNNGQAAYSAANSFMAGLAEQRRRQGLAASVIDIGAVMGVGYATQIEETPFVYTRAGFQKQGLLGMSEQDLLQLFAEAVLSGSSGSPNSTEIIAGVRTVTRQDEIVPAWENIPMMSHFVLETRRQDNDGPGSHSSQPFGARLAEANDQDELFGLLRNAFIARLGTLLQVDTTEIDKGNLVAMRLDELGIDSLTAVDIQAWFMKTAEVNIPVLKILNGSTIRDLLAIAVQEIPARLVPNIKPNSHTASETFESATEDSGARKNSRNSTSDTQRDASLPLFNTDGDDGATADSVSTITKMIPLSSSQASSWANLAHVEGGTGLNRSLSARINGLLRLEDLKRAVLVLGKQHEMLRTCFPQHEGLPMQAIMEDSVLHLECRQIHHLEEFAETAMDVQRHVFDIARGETMRLVLLSRSPTEHYLIVGFVKLVLDGVSFQAFLRSLLLHYTKTFPLPEIPQFSDYSQMERRALTSGELGPDFDYWTQQFAKPPPPLPILSLSSVPSRPELATCELTRATLRIRPSTKTKILDVCRRFKATPFHFYLATLRALMLRYGQGQEDVVIGMEDANRGYHMMDTIGPFVNVLPLRLRAQITTEFGQILDHVRTQTYEALAHAKLPTQALLDKLNLPYSTTHATLIQCVVDYRMGQSERMQWGTNHIEFLDFEVGRLHMDIYVDITDSSGGDAYHAFSMRKDMYGRVAVETFARAYELAIEAFVNDPSMTADRLTVHGAEEVEPTVGPILGEDCPSLFVRPSELHDTRGGTATECPNRTAVKAESRAVEEAAAIVETSYPSRRARKPLAFYLAFTGLCFAMFAFSLDTTTLPVAIPSIAKQLGGTSLESFWAGISYLLGVVVTQPLYAAVSDVFGRKPPLYVAFLLFIAGSLVFALARTMTTIIAGRVLQGLGAGGLNVLCDIIVADMTTLQERSFYLGLTAIPIALGSIPGTSVGAVFSTYVDWRWIGWVNLPLLSVAFPLVFFFLRLKPLDATLQSKLARLDWVGLALLTVGATAFVTPLSWAGTLFPWGSWRTLLPLLVGLAVLVVFAVYESRPEAPIVPHRLFRSRTAVMALIGAFIHGMTLYSLLQYLPFFYQSVLLETVIQSAVTLLPASSTSCISAGLSVLALSSSARGGYRLRIRACWILATLGSGCFALLETDSSRSMRLGIPVMWAAGIGGLIQLLMLPIQASVQSVDDIGAAVSLLLSVRYVGGLVGVAIGATVFSSTFGAAMVSVHDLPDSLAILKDANNAIGFIPTLRTLDLPPEVMAPILQAYLEAMRAVFYTMTGFGAVGFFSSVFMEVLSLDKMETGRQRFEE